MGIFRRSKTVITNPQPEREPRPMGSPEPITPEHLEHIEELRIWDGQWKLDTRDMTWKRSEYFYVHTNFAGRSNQYIARHSQQHRGPMIRPGPLKNVVHLDVPLAVLRSHPDSPGALPEDQEGYWTDTNPAWPELSINHILGKYGLSAAWEDSSPDLTETYDLIPTFVEDINPCNSEPFDPTPLSLSAVLIYARPAEEIATSTKV